MHRAEKGRQRDGDVKKTRGDGPSYSIEDGESGMKRWAIERCSRLKTEAEQARRRLRLLMEMYRAWVYRTNTQR